VAKPIVARSWDWYETAYWKVINLRVWVGILGGKTQN